MAKSIIVSAPNALTSERVAVPENFAALGNWARGYYVSLPDRVVYSAHVGNEMRELTPYMGRYKIGTAPAMWIPREAIAKAKRAKNQKKFFRR